MVVNDYDFCGWATKNDVLCADGRTIRKDAFKNCDGVKVPLVWNHKHDGPLNVLGHALLENCPEGVRAYGYFNKTNEGLHAKESLRNGDINSLSIFANNLKQIGGDVMHGVIREVSLVLAGANPEATIDTVIAHGAFDENSVEIRFNEIIETPVEEVIEHSEVSETEEVIEHSENDKEEESKMGADNNGNSEELTMEEVFKTYEALDAKQKTAVDALVGMALNENSSKGETENMKHNLFDSESNNMDEQVLCHDALNEIIADAQKGKKSLRDNVLAHSGDYGIDNVEYLFPEARNMTREPEFIKRDTDWVSDVMNSVHHTPFSRIKSIFADITEDEARAKGYIKGKLKKEEVFSLLKRSTSPTTIYKKQKMDRNDILDITDIDVVGWIKTEMRGMLNEEIARAILIGDGRLASDDDKIDENCIRPVVNDAELFTIRWGVAAGSTDDDKAKNFIRAAIKSRKAYKGSGNPTLYTTEDMLTDMLLLEDGIGHKLYKTEAELATTLRVKKIVTVPVMEGYTDKEDKEVYGIIVNLTDYNVGADKGGSINMFEDFDIDYNQEKYLMETRCSGALVKPFSAVVLRAGATTASEAKTLADAKAELEA